MACMYMMRLVRNACVNGYAETWGTERTIWLSSFRVQKALHVDALSASWPAMNAIHSMITPAGDTQQDVKKACRAAEKYCGRLIPTTPECLRCLDAECVIQPQVGRFARCLALLT